MYICSITPFQIMPIRNGLIKKFSSIQTPFYFYDMELLRKTLDRLQSASSKYGIDCHYAIKANSEPRIMQMISARGLGADCVSGNEILHAVRYGFKPEGIVYAGVGKTDREIDIALSVGSSFNCESIPEIKVISQRAAAMGVKAKLSVRVNPNIDAHTHRYITTGLDENKFGIPVSDFDSVIDIIKESDNLEFMGLHFHVGSQIMDVKEVFGLACVRAANEVKYFEEHELEVKNIDFGGGLGIDYEYPDIRPYPDFTTWFDTVSKMQRRPGQKLHLEPGRSLVGQCGSLITRVIFVKAGETRNFLIVDAGMTDLIRPALYGAYHKIDNLSSILRGMDPDADDELQYYDVVGPICESSDVWGNGRQLPVSYRGDLIAIRSAGAYGQTMASQYNMRDLAPAVFSDQM